MMMALASAAFAKDSKNDGINFNQKLIEYSKAAMFADDAEERGEVEKVPLNVITHKYIMHKEYMFGLDLDYKTYHQLRQHIEFSMLI